MEVHYMLVNWVFRNVAFNIDFQEKEAVHGTVDLFGYWVETSTNVWLQGM